MNHIQNGWDMIRIGSYRIGFELTEETVIFVRFFHNTMFILSLLLLQGQDAEAEGRTLF